MSALLIRLALGGLIFLSKPVWAQTNFSPGIAANYPGDVGIASDPNVIKAEDFSGGTVADLPSRWTQVGNIGDMAYVNDTPAGSASPRSLQIVVPSGGDSYLYQMLSPGENNSLFLRYYVKYASGSSYHHAGGWMGGYNPPTNYPQGRAGIRPTGGDWFNAAAEPVDSTGRFDYYNYWMGMGGGSCCGGYWGNEFIDDASLKITPGQWMCVEVMVDLNNPVTSNNGQLAMWVNGQLVSYLGQGFPNGTFFTDSNGNWVGVFQPNPSGRPWPGFQWRSDSALNLNWIWLHDYTDSFARLQYANIVLARSHVGCLPPAGAKPPAKPSNLKIF